MRAPVYTALTLGALVVGYIRGYGVGVREVQDSDTQLLCGEPLWLVGEDGVVVKGTVCQRPANHTGDHNSNVEANVEAVAGPNGG